MDYILENASEIMKLCFGFGFLMMAIFITLILHRTWVLLVRVDAIASFLHENIQKPFRLLSRVYSSVSKISRLLGDDDPDTPRK